jgi:hypothetical protein
MVTPARAKPHTGNSGAGRIRRLAGPGRAYVSFRRSAGVRRLRRELVGGIAARPDCDHRRASLFAAGLPSM